MQNTNRIFYLDLLRVLAIVLVILIHTFGYLSTIVVFPISIKLVYWFFNAGVPLFVMISGALILGRDEEPSNFLSKRLKRVFVPFFFWSIIVFVLKFKNIYDGNGHIFNEFLSYCRNFIPYLLENKIHGIYWYVYMLIGLYLIAPILQKSFAKGGEKLVRYAVILFVAFFIIKSIFPSFYMFKYYDFHFIGFFICGFYIHKYVKNKHAALAIIGIVVSFILSWIHFYYNIGLPYIQIETISIYLLFKGLPSPKKWPIVFMISRYSYVMYLSHFLLVSILYKHQIVPLVLEPAFMCLVILIVLLLVFYLVDKLKFANKIVGI